MHFNMKKICISCKCHYNVHVRSTPTFSILPWLQCWQLLILKGESCEYPFSEFKKEGLLNLHSKILLEPMPHEMEHVYLKSSIICQVEMGENCWYISLDKTSKLCFLWFCFDCVACSPSSKSVSSWQDQNWEAFWKNENDLVVMVMVCKKKKRKGRLCCISNGIH